MRKIGNILVTGGAGFIGSNFIRYLFKNTDFAGQIINMDKLTYAGNLLNLADIQEAFGGKRYFFLKTDICDFAGAEDAFKKYDVDTVVHFAAESHVDRSIFGPGNFIQTNIIGTFTLLETARKLWKGRNDVLFHHVSTDEVYGSLGKDGYFYETTPYSPRSPYSASKASSDHLVGAYHHTYGLPITISNCSNNYGPYQYPEKLIPLIIANMMEGKNLPVYGDGKNIRDWLHVSDHCNAIWLILNKGTVGQTYNIGGESECENLKLVNFLCEKMSALKNKDQDHYKNLVEFVEDRAGHDRRYAINCDKIKKELNWQRKFDLETGLAETIAWYTKNPKWIAEAMAGGKTSS